MSWHLPLTHSALAIQFQIFQHLKQTNCECSCKSCAAHAAASHVQHIHDVITSVCDHPMQFTVVCIKAKAQAKVGLVSQVGLL